MIALKDESDIVERDDYDRVRRGLGLGYEDWDEYASVLTEAQEEQGTPGRRPVEVVEGALGEDEDEDEEVELEDRLKDHEKWIASGGTDGKQLDFSHRALQEASFYGRDLSDAVFHKADLQGCDFDLATLDRTDFSEADLQHSSFGGSESRDINLTGADIRNTDWSSATVMRPEMDGAKRDSTTRGLVIKNPAPDSLKLTKKQREWVEWALDAMREYAETPDDSGYTKDDLPVLKGSTLTAGSGEAMEDLVWRLQHQLTDMAESELDTPGPTLAAVNRLCDKLRKLTMLENYADEDDEGGDERQCQECGDIYIYEGPEEGYVAERFCGMRCAMISEIPESLRSPALKKRKPPRSNPAGGRKLYLIRKGKKKALKMPEQHASKVAVPGERCCGGDLYVYGRDMRPSEDDRAWESDAYRACCNEHEGTLRLETGTLFGVREDAAMERYTTIRGPRRNPAGLKKSFLAGCAKAFWTHSFETILKNLDIKEPMPEVPKVAVRDARIYTKQIENGSKTKIEKLIKAAAEADGVEADDELAEQLGYSLAMESMGTKVSWWKKHEDFDISYPEEFDPEDTVDEVFEFLIQKGYDTGITEDTASDVTGTYDTGEE